MTRSDPPHQVRHHITNQNTTVTEVLSQHFGLTPAQIAMVFHFGAIYQNKKRILEDRPLETGEYLRVHLKPKRFAVDEINWKECVVHEHEEFILVDKPPGIPTIASVDNRIENVLHQMREATHLNLLVTQRIDVPVGGLVVFAKTGRFQEWFNKALSEHKVDKFYKALVQKPISSGRKTHFMEPSDRAPKTLGAEEKTGWLKCELTTHTCDKFAYLSPTMEAEAMAPAEKLYELTLQLHTGRTHQIRAQLSYLGSPILGDKAYGSDYAFPYATLTREHIGLACVKIRFRKGYEFEFELLPYWRRRSHQKTLTL